VLASPDMACERTPLPRPYARCALVLMLAAPCRPSSRAIAVAAVAACSLCVMAIVFTAGRPAGSAELLFKTPKLKDLLGTFMKNQGASAKDITEMDKYYKGAAKKGRAQMLDDISSEFDPITDADSNYGRVIGVKVASRTNPAIAEDMDVSGERKARVQVRSRERGLHEAACCVWDTLFYRDVTRVAG